MASFSPRKFMDTFNSQLEPQIQSHLKNVYSCVALSTLSATCGAYVHLFTNIMSGGFFSAVLAIGFMLGLFATPDNNGKNRKLRLALLMGFALMSGLGLGPLLDYVIYLNPSIIANALLMTSVVFACFTMSALLARRGYWLYLGGTLSSLLTVLLCLSLARMIFGFQLLHQAYMYLGVFVMCSFILYDTQMIVEKRSMGDKDYVAHSLDLFVDLLDLFRFLLVLLTEKEQRKKKNSRNQ